MTVRSGVNKESDGRRENVTSVPFWVLMPFLIIIGLHIIGVFYPDYSTWGFNYWSLFRAPFSLGILALALVLIAFHANPSVVGLSARLFGRMSQSQQKGKRVALGMLVALLVFGVLFLLRSRAHIYGDGFTVLAKAADPQGLKFFRQYFLQVLSVVLQHYSVIGFNRTLAIEPEPAFALTNCVGGLFGVWALYRISGLLAADTFRRWFIFIASMTSGAVILFFGYIENYTWATVLSLWTLYFILRHVRGHGGAKPALLLMLLAAAFHLVTLPYLVVAFLVIFTPKSWFDKFTSGYPALGSVIVLVLASAGLALLVQQTDLPDVFVPLWPLPENAYWALSWSHVKDLVNQALLVAPLGTIMLMLSRFARNSNPGVSAPEGRILASVSLLSFLVSFWVDPTLGAVRDWDLLSFYGFPFSLWGAYRLSDLIPRRSQARALIVPAMITAIIHVAPNLYEKTHPKLATHHLDSMLWQSPQHQVSYKQARRAMVWGTILRDSVDEPELAVKHFRRRLSVDSTCATSWFGIGDWFAKQKQYDSAAFYWRHMARHDETYAGYLLKLAAVEAELQNFDTARQIMAQCLKLAPEDYRVQYTAGLIASAAGNPYQALSYFREAHRLKPDDDKSVLNIGLIYSHVKQYDSAYVYLKRSEKAFAGNLDAYRALITAEVALGRLDEVRQTLEQYRKLNPTATLESLRPESSQRVTPQQ